MERVCDILEQLVSEGTLKAYALGGASAAGFHGKPIATRDIDVFVYLEPPSGSLLITLEPLYGRLKQMGFSEFEEEGLLIHGFPVQFISRSPGLEEEALEQAVSVEWEEHRARVMISPPWPLPPGVPRTEPASYTSLNSPVLTGNSFSTFSPGTD